MAKKNEGMGFFAEWNTERVNAREGDVCQRVSAVSGGREGFVLMKQGMIQSALDWSYGKAVNGVTGFSSARELAEDFLGGSGNLHEKALSLVRWQCAKAGSAGFISGLGGASLLPVSLPANMAGFLFINIRMIAALAIMGEHDVRDDRVRSLVYVCLCGNAAREALKEAGLETGKRAAQQALKNIPGSMIQRINQRAGYRFLTKFGERGTVNLVKAIPLLSGFIGGGIDALSTRAVGNVALETFIGSKDGDVSVDSLGSGWRR